jgi:hypothetical protein
MRRWIDLFRQEAGSAALVFAVAAPLVIGGAAAAVDMAALTNQRTHMQSIADAAALAGAKQLHLYRTDFAPVEEGTRQYALAALPEHRLDPATTSVDATVGEEGTIVTVNLDGRVPTYLLSTLGYDSIEVTAVARAFGSARLCVLSLDRSGSSAIHGFRIAAIEAAECAVQANSSASDAIDLDLLSTITARSICAAGGVDAPRGAFEPDAETDCPQVEDPIADHALPPIPGCDFEDMKIILPRRIYPGHYCGGLVLGPTALVTAEPGDYIISGGPLVLAPASSLVGEGVSFRFVDADSTFAFGLGSIVRLAAPESGPMAGFLFFQDPGVEENVQFTIATDLATELLGTVYLPHGTLKIDVIGLVAAQSAYTVVVADRIDINGARLVINSDYGATDVPVPAGVGPNSGQITLER